MKHRILYLGDTALGQQAAYLAGIMSYYNYGFDYLRSDEAFSDALLEREYGLVIISDYPASNFSEKQMRRIAGEVKGGMALLMIGGWESFKGSGGDYDGTILAEVLPVTMKKQDDRVNFSSPCLVIKEQSHEIIDSLPFDRNLPAIGGLNAFNAKPHAAALLSAVEYQAARNGEAVDFKKDRQFPLLVVGDYFRGRTAAFASDVAPHWVGPLVDWGSERIKAQADGSEAIEVGNWYAQFFINLIRWMLREL
jgi:hypothetical protein